MLLCAHATGFKADFGAHNMHSTSNFYAYVDAAWAGWPSSDGSFVSNSVILGGKTFSYFGTGYKSVRNNTAAQTDF